MHTSSFHEALLSYNGIILIILVILVLISMKRLKLAHFVRV